MAIQNTGINDVSSLIPVSMTGVEEIDDSSYLSEPEVDINDTSVLEPVTLKEVPERFKERPQMKAVETSFGEDVSDFASEMYDNLKSGDSFSLLQNVWRSAFDSVKIATPTYDEKGNFSGSRIEDDQEHQERLKMNKEIRQKGLDTDSAAAISSKVVGILIDPTTWAIPMGGSYKAVKAGTSTLTKEVGKVSAMSATFASVDSIAYQKATEGSVDPKTVGLTAALATVLGPMVWMGGNKAAEVYQAAFNSTKNKDVALDAVKEELSDLIPLLPAPEDKLFLPAPKYMGHAPIRVEPTPIQKEFSAWEEKELVEFMRKDAEISRMWEDNESVSKIVQRSLGAHKAERETLAQVVDESINPESTMAHAFAKNLALEERATDKLIEKEMWKKGQEGLSNVDIMAHLATTSAGAALGGGVAGEEGAVAGALLGFATPSSARAMYKTVGKLSEWSKQDYATKVSSAYLLSRPSAVLRSYGKYGRTLANNIRRAQENVDMSIGHQVQKLDRFIGHMKKEEMLNVQRLLQHTTRKGTPREVAAAKQIRREFNEVLDEGVKVGLFDRKHANHLKAKASKDGYFPRIYDNVYLSSSKGKEHFVSIFTKEGMTAGKGNGFTREGMETALKSILGEDKKLVQEFMKIAEVNNSVYTLSKSAASDLLKLRRHVNSHGRSTHLERARKIHPDTESILEPFLTKDPSVAIIKYFEDSLRRIEYARIFDKVDDKGKLQVDFYAKKIFDGIRKEHGSHAGRTAEQTYYTMVGDHGGSDIIKAHLNMREGTRKALEIQDNYETITKLGMAQMPNMMQATVNGITYLLGRKNVNPYQAFSIYGKGLVKSLGKEGGEFTDRAGAALETTLMEIAGEAGSISKWGEGYLKLVGFIGAEKLQRRLGANLGRSYAEHLQSRYERVISGAIKDATGKKKISLMKEMKEAGLPIRRAVTGQDLERAGLRFSNMVNFRNTPDNLPIMSQSPYAKVFRKFKTFAFHQGVFVKENVMKPFLQGNPLPLLWYTGPAATMGMGIDELRRFFKSDDRELNGLERYLRGITMIGGFGLMQDILSSAKDSPERAASSMVGPAISDALTTAHGAAKSIESGDLTPLVKFYGQTLVFPGKNAILGELSEEGLKRGGDRSSSRSEGRSSGR